VTGRGKGSGGGAKKPSFENRFFNTDAPGQKQWGVGGKAAEKKKTSKREGFLENCNLGEVKVSVKRKKKNFPGGFGKTKGTT